MSQWADPNYAIPGWPVVDGPAQQGDILSAVTNAKEDGYFRPGQQMGIATGDGTSIGIHRNETVQETDWGFRDGQDPTIRRNDTQGDDQTAQP